MKPRFLVWHGLTLLALAAPVAYLAARWPALPAVVPTHFDASGRANGYGSKNLLLFLAGALPAAVWLLLLYLPRLDPKRRLDAANPNFQKLRLVVQLLVGGAGGFAVHAAGGGNAAAHALPWGMAGLLGLFALLGNYLGTVPPNYFVGIRTPWTLESPAVWARTHRLAGRLLFWGGLAGAALVWALPTKAALPVVLTVTVGVSLVALGYSRWLYGRLAHPTAAE